MIPFIPKMSSSDPLDKRCRLSDLNAMITCNICHGYLIDATTVTECLHTFCKSCIVKHLEDNNTCPECDDLIHQSHPLDYVAFDRTLQDLVYKIVPGLEQDEHDRERKFYADRGLPCPKDQAPEEDEEDEDEENESKADNGTPDTETNMDYHRFDEQVNLLLECKARVDDASDQDETVSEAKGEKEKSEGDQSKASTSSATSTSPAKDSRSQQQQLKGLKRKFVRCSSLATVTHLKKFIAKKLLHSVDRYKDLDIMCNDEPLYKDHTLKFVYVTRWRTKEPPLKLQYVPKLTAPMVP